MEPCLETADPPWPKDLAPALSSPPAPRQSSLLCLLRSPLLQAGAGREDNQLGQ